MKKKSPKPKGALPKLPKGFTLHRRLVTVVEDSHNYVRVIMYKDGRSYSSDNGYVVGPLYTTKPPQNAPNTPRVVKSMVQELKRAGY